jgi:hypothetical protein
MILAAHAKSHRERALRMESPHRLGFGPCQLDLHDERLWRETESSA